MAKTITFDVNVDSKDSAKTLGSLRAELEKINEELEQTERQYNEFRELQNRKTYFNSRLLSKIEGEKPTKYFLNIEKNLSTQKYISLLTVKDAEGRETNITSQPAI